MAILSLNKILANKVQSQLAGSDAVLIKTVQDLSSDVQSGPNGDRATIPRMSGLTLKSVTQGTRSVGDTYTTEGDVLLLDQPKEVSTYFGYTDNANSTVDRQSAFFDGAPRIYAQGLEALIADQLQASGPNDFNSKADAVSGVINYSIKDFTEAKKLLDEQKVPKSERYAAVNAEGMAIISAWSEFQDGSKSLSDEALKMGVVSQIKGFKVIQSEDLADNKITCYHVSSIAFAHHKEMASIVKDIEEYAEVFVALRGKYGCKLLDTGKRKVTITAKPAGA